MFEKISLSLIISCGFGLTLWLMRYWLAQLSTKVDCTEKGIQDLLRTILKEYTPSKKCDKRELWIIKNEERLEVLEQWRAYTEGVTNGKKGGKLK